MSKSRRSGYVTSGLIHDPDYCKAPTTPDPEWLEARVQAYRHGETDLQHTLIFAHLRLAAAIAGEFGRKRNRDDIVGVAMLALVDAVRRAATALNDNNITPYISKVIRDQIKEFIARDRAVFMPLRTFRHKIAKGEISTDGENTDQAVIGVVSVPLRVESDARYKEDSSGDFIRLNQHQPWVAPESKPDKPSVEFQEALQLAIRTDTERRVIDLRTEGYKYEDMETILGLKKSRIGDHVNAVKDRFLAIYAS